MKKLCGRIFPARPRFSWRSDFPTAHNDRRDLRSRASRNHLFTFVIFSFFSVHLGDRRRASVAFSIARKSLKSQIFSPVTQSSVSDSNCGATNLVWVELSSTAAYDFCFNLPWKSRWKNLLWKVFSSVHSCWCWKLFAFSMNNFPRCWDERIQLKCVGW